MKKKEIPIFFTFDKNYVVAASVAFFSLLKHADKRYDYRLFVVHTHLSVKAQNKLHRVIARFDNATLTFVDVSTLPLEENIQQGKSHFSKEIYYKLIAADLFPQYDRILCSDVDVVFTGDIAPSYFMYPDEFFYYAGVGQILASKRMETYGSNDFQPEELDILEQEIAAGYLLLNLKAMRQQKMQQQLSRFYQANYRRLRLPEQDCMILCCYPHVRHLPMEYVVCNTYYRTSSTEAVFYTKNRFLPTDRQEQQALYDQALQHPIQLHYVGLDKPWHSFFVPKQRLWFRILKEAGLTGSYLVAVPSFVRQHLRRYSLKRFIKKMYISLTKAFKLQNHE